MHPEAALALSGRGFLLPSAMNFSRRFLLFLLLCAAACGPKEPQGPQEYAIEGRAMGTTYTVKLVAESPLDVAETDRLAGLVFDAIEDVNNKMSTYKEDSELSRFNQLKTSEPFAISAGTLKVLLEAQRIGALSNGAYDVTVGPLVNLWGFGPGLRANDLSDEAIEAARASVGWEKIEIDADSSTIRKLHPGVYVDLSSIAKGYGSDQVALALESAGYFRYLVEIGGEMRAYGLNIDGEPWRVGVERPVENERVIQRVVPLENLSMATSGDYRNYYDAGGERISHTIDPRTGRPVRGRVAAVTVIDPSCMTADGWATALTALGEEEGFAVAERERLTALFQLRRDDGTFEQKPTAAFLAQFGEATQ
jgi:thiamine biosynthesis lipoprotein